MVDSLCVLIEIVNIKEIQVLKYYLKPESEKKKS
jgi:hypothetical protein